jgi:hypothetical protein
MSDSRASIVSTMTTKATAEPLKFMDLDPLETARQLTLIEHELFFNIKVFWCIYNLQPREFLDCAWMKDTKETFAPNIMKMVRWSNHVVAWLVTEVVSNKENLKQRVLVMEKIIQLAMVIKILILRLLKS